MAQKTEYHQSKIGSLAQVIVGAIKRNPAVIDNIDLLKATVYAAMPELKDRSKCANCGASMKEYVYTFDAWDAILLMRMGDVMKEQLHKSDFTKANTVRVPDLNVSHAVKCRTTQMSKLGLIAQLRGTNGKRVPGMWVITRRGFEALAGKPVPKMVKVWRKKIEERFEETITIKEALQSHVKYVELQEKKGKEAKEDNRAYIAQWDPQEWYQFSVHEGNIM